MANQLPFLLCGPILRRTEPGRVYLWLATSRAVQSAEAELTGASGRIPADTAVQSHALGARLFVHLLEITPGGPLQEFPFNTLIAYDVLLAPDTDTAVPEEQRSLRHWVESAGGDWNHYVLAGQASPTFYVAQDLPMEYLQGSCRKPHGHGADAVTCMAARLSRSATHVSPRWGEKRRPAALFLTGDQIYADDISPPVLRHVMELGRALAGYDESIPFRDGARPASRIKDRPAGLVTGFTSTDSNQLLAFAEYAAMYLTVWNPQRWVPRSYIDRYGMSGSAGYVRARNRLDRNTTTANIAALADAKEKRDAIRNEAARLRQFGKAIPAMTRVLANVPTYMMFDDHEVTDDWNLVLPWTRIVNDYPDGRRVVGNALAAFWAFQSLGNEPVRPRAWQRHADERLVNAIGARLDHLDKTGGRDDPRAAKKFDSVLAAHRAWSFVAPTEPLALVLDTRTRRYDDLKVGPKKLRSARLLDDPALDDIGPALKAAGYPDTTSRKPGPPLMIVSPPPVYGFRRAEWLIANRLPYAGMMITDLDFESWAANREGYQRFMETLIPLNPSYFVFLSGDVHYAMTVQTTIRSRRLAAPLVALQLTSSALKNQPHGSRSKALWGAKKSDSGAFSELTFKRGGRTSFKEERIHKTPRYRDGDRADYVLMKSNCGSLSIRSLNRVANAVTGRLHYPKRSGHVTIATRLSTRPAKNRRENFLQGWQEQEYDALAEA